MELNEKELERILAFCKKKLDVYDYLVNCNDDELLTELVTESNTLQDVKARHFKEFIIYNNLYKKLLEYKGEN